MLAAVWLMLSGLLYTLQLSTGSFPKPLTEEEDKHYLTLCRQGDLQARDILIERNLRLVAHIMKKYYAQTADQEDLISIGTIGLIKAVTTFDETKGWENKDFRVKVERKNGEVIMILERVGSGSGNIVSGQ